MYIVSLLRRIFRPSNIGTVIFFLLNAFMVIGIFTPFGRDAVLQVAIVYVVSVVLSLSPLGEWALGVAVGARRMTRVDMQKRILPIARRVHKKALTITPDMTKKIKVKVSYDPTPNAFALGRHTICVTEGLFSLPDSMIEGVIAHEIGHLACHHTDMQLLIGGGNIIISLLLLTLKLISGLIAVIGAIFSFSRNGVTRGCGCFISIVGVICSLAVFLWTRFCMLFLMWSSRSKEFVADKFAVDIGRGYGLCAALDTIGTGKPKSSLLKALYSTHPDANDRIGKMQEMGIPYSRY